LPICNVKSPTALGQKTAVERLHMNRRSFVKAMAIAGVPTVVKDPLSLSGVANATEPEAARLTLAGYPFEHVTGLAAGLVVINGRKVDFQAGAIGDLNSHVFSGPRTLDVTEIGLSPYLLAFANEAFRAYSLIPVFPLRTFRHKSIFVNTDSGIASPADLRGKRIATPGYSSTSLTWIRGIMQHEYGVQPEEIEWVLSAQDSAAEVGGTASKQERLFPDGLTLSEGPIGKDESDLLADGDVDALFHAAEPRAYVEGHPKVRRLFADPRQTERDYFGKTGIFPIIHAVAIRNDLIERDPQFPRAVFEAYSNSKRQAYAEMRKKWFLRAMPWFAEELDATIALMGENFAPYGVEANRKALQTLFRYWHEQGLASREVEVDEIFEPSTLELSEEQ
jgi:4,5-dihydroxyphthalate decarboxylase